MGMERIDLGVCRGHWFAGDPHRVAVLLPGAGYVPAAPLLWFAREILQAQGWTVLDVWDEWDRSVDPHQWVTERFEAAFERVGEVSTRVVVAKSLSTLAIPAALDLDLAGIWLTPLLDEEGLRSALLSPKSKTLLIGGTADPTWDSEFVGGLPNVEVLEIEGGDHLMQHRGEPGESIQTLQVVTDRIGRFTDQLV